MATAAQDFAKFYSGWEKELDDVLKRASREASKRIGDIPMTIGSAQASMARRAAHGAISGAYEQVYGMLKTGRIDAARLGATLSDEEIAAFRAAGIDGEALDALTNALRYQGAASVEAAARRVEGHIPLSQQVYRTTQLSKGAVDKAINMALAQGLSASQLAKLVSGMINPNMPGGVSYAAKRLGRTELNNAFHESAKARLASAPWVDAVRWHLSGSHGVHDICNQYAENDNEGIGEGLWPAGKVPAKPHPQCLCYVSAELPSDKQFVDTLRTGAYDPYVDDVMRQAGYDEAFIAQSRFSTMAREAKAAKDFAPKPFKMKDVWNTRISKSERESLFDYQQTSFVRMNNVLRAGEVPEGKTLRRITDIDNVMSRSRIQDGGVKVYRGIDDAEEFGIADVQVGDTMLDLGFMSTSRSAETAERFTHSRTAGATIEIDVPGGARGLSYGEEQQEMLLDRGSGIRITSITRDARDRLYIKGVMIQP